MLISRTTIGTSSNVHPNMYTLFTHKRYDTYIDLPQYGNMGTLWWISIIILASVLDTIGYG